MSWCKFALMAVCLTLGLSGCGFEPMYAKNSSLKTAPVAAELAGIRVLGIPDRNGQLLRNDLLQRLTPYGEPGAAQYNLIVKLTESQQGLAEQKDGKTSLGNLIINASFRLIEVGGKDAALFSSLAHSVVSYRYLGPRYGTVAAERDAQERAISDVADNISMQLAAYFADPKRANKQAAQ